MPKVYHNRDKDIPPGSVYVGRPTKWGNPYTHLPGRSLAKYTVPTRQEAIDAYEKWIMEQPDLIAQAKTELAGKNLVCWCAPEPCHADILLKIANSD